MNQLYFGDNLQVLRDHIADASVDLVYLDPPFNSKRDYNLLFKTPKGHQSDAQIAAFEDSWHWGEQAEREFSELLQQPNTDVAQLMTALRSFLVENDMMAYLVMMANRLLQLHRVLKPTGSLYLHCDPSASHYLKIVLDGVFGLSGFQNEIIWKRTTTHGAVPVAPGVGEADAPEYMRQYEVLGTPQDLGGARDLAARDKYQFQWWACSLVNAQPFQGRKKGADGGIDGLIFFQDDTGKAKKIVVSVKGGDNVNVAMVRDLAHVVAREKAAIGLFVTLAEPSKPMTVEAVKEGFYRSPVTGAEFPKLQILTIAGLLAGGEQARYPDLTRGGLTFKHAQPEAAGGDQQGLF